jgi:AcrR family transcriptional regulator
VSPVELPKVLPEYKTIAKTRILESARAMFRESGFKDTTMDGIAKKLGISKAALYTYFKDKEELFNAAYESSPRELEKIIEWVVSKGETRKAFRAFFDEVMPGAEKSIALDFEVISEATRNPELKGVLRKQFDEYLEAVQRCVETTSRRKRSDAKGIARSITALWYGLETMIALGYPIEEVRYLWNGTMEKLLGP